MVDSICESGLLQKYGIIDNVLHYSLAVRCVPRVFAVKKSLLVIKSAVFQNAVSTSASMFNHTLGTSPQRCLRQKSQPTPPAENFQSQEALHILFAPAST
jgi:hypothetical protein